MAATPLPPSAQSAVDALRREGRVQHVSDSGPAVVVAFRNGWALTIRPAADGRWECVQGHGGYSQPAAGTPLTVSADALGGLLRDVSANTPHSSTITL